jgi:hypothetical protein
LGVPDAAVDPEILVVIQGSPLRERTEALVESIRVYRGPAVRVVLISPRPTEPIDGVDVRETDPDWAGHVRTLVAESRCRYFVTPSSVDRYLPGAFEAVLQTKAGDEQSIVGRALVQIGDGVGELGPRPFRFDYFALLSGFNYIAPGVAFIAAERFLAEGGFDRRFPNAAVYEYLLRTGGAHGAAACETPLIMTRAAPFPGVPSEYSTLHALECLRAALEHHRALPPPGATLGLVAMLADQLGPMRHHGYYDERLMRVLTSGVNLKQVWLEYVGLRAVRSPTAEDGRHDSRSFGRLVVESVAAPFCVTPQDRPGLNAFGEDSGYGYTQSRRQLARLKVGLRRVMPTRVWNVLQRGKRALRAFRDPLT